MLGNRPPKWWCDRNNCWLSNISDQYRSMFIESVVVLEPAENWITRITSLGSDSHFTSQWRHNERDGVSNHQPQDCLLRRLFRRRSTKTSKLRVTGLCEGNSPVTGEFPAQRASNAENQFDDVIITNDLSQATEICFCFPAFGFLNLNHNKFSRAMRHD